MIEVINIKGEKVQQIVVPIAGDCACLFRSHSFLMYGNQGNTFNVRREIFNYVINNWDEFSITSHNRNGDNYKTADEYYEDMIQPATYGGLCELVAAGKIYNFFFEVYRNGELYVDAGTRGRPMKHLRFSQNVSSDHFDGYLSKSCSKY